MNSAEARSNEICNLSRVLYRALMDHDPTEFPGDWHSQLGKSTLSIGSNWVEGIGRRGTPKAPLAFWRHARGSAYEAAFQFATVGLRDLAQTADTVCDLIDDAIASRLYESLEDSEGQSVGLVGAAPADCNDGLAKVLGGSYPEPDGVRLGTGCQAASVSGLSGCQGSVAERSAQPAASQDEDARVAKGLRAPHGNLVAGRLPAGRA